MMKRFWHPIMAFTYPSPLFNNTRAVLPGHTAFREFLARNHGVFICARSEGSLNAALAALQADFPNGSVAGVAADVSRPVDVEELAGRAAAELGTVHYWLNNAGACRQLAQCPNSHAIPQRQQPLKKLQ